MTQVNRLRKLPLVCRRNIWNNRAKNQLFKVALNGNHIFFKVSAYPICAKLPKAAKKRQSFRGERLQAGGIQGRNVRSSSEYNGDCNKDIETPRLKKRNCSRAPHLRPFKPSRVTQRRLG